MGFGYGCCCGQCDIFVDAFTANDGRPHAGWTNRPAIFSTAGGDEAENSGGSLNFAKPNVQKCNTPNPEGAGSPTAVYTKFKLTETTPGNGVNFRVIIGYLDDDNYLFARVSYLDSTSACHSNGGTASVDSGQINLFKVVAGVETFLATAEGFTCASRIKGLTLDTWHELWLCHIPNNYGTYGDGDTLRCRVKLNGVTDHNPGCQGVADGFTGGAYAGLANAPTAANDSVVKFKDFKYSYFRGTDHLSCPNCNGPCPIFSDTFAYDDTEQDVFHNINCMWATNDSFGNHTGTARFLDGQLEVESGGSVLCGVPHPTNKSSKILTVSFLWEASILIRIDTGSGYAILDSTPAIRQIRIYDNDDNLLASSDLLALPAADDAVHTVEVCLESGAITVTMDGVCLDAVSEDTHDPFVYLGSDGGTVHFTSFSFAKHKDLTEPKDGNCEVCDCPRECNDCCDDPQPAGAYVVDLGVGGWASLTCVGVPGVPSCNDCEDTAGEFIVLSSADCVWRHDQSNCDIDNCCVGAREFGLAIILSLENNLTGCRWKVVVALGPSIVDVDAGCFHDASIPNVSRSKIVVYYSDYLTGTDKCNTMPVTLTKSSEGGDFPCSGSLPSTITLEAA